MATYRLTWKDGFFILLGIMLAGWVAEIMFYIADRPLIEVIMIQMTVFSLYMMVFFWGKNK